MIAIIIAVIGGSGLNVSFMVGLAFAVAASANFPALLLALTWRRFNTDGRDHRRRCSASSASIVLIIVSPKVWPGADTGHGLADRLDAVDNPGIVSIPLGFLGCFAGHDAEHASSEHGAHVRRAVRALRDGPGRREGVEPERVLAPH